MTATYALLIYRNTPDAPMVSAAEEQDMLKQHQKLQSETIASGQLRALARLADPPSARVVTQRAGAHDVSDGPFIETKEWLVGLYLVECDNEDQALEWARCIAPRDYSVEVRATTWNLCP